MDNASEIIVTQDERTMGTLAHVLQLVGGWIGPLVIFFVKRDSKFVSFHALQVLLLQGIYAVAWMGLMAAWFVGIFGTIFTRQMAQGSQSPPLIIMLLFPLMMILAVVGGVTVLVLAIVYGIKAGRGEWAKLPLLGDWAARILKISVP